MKWTQGRVYAAAGCKGGYRMQCAGLKNRGRALPGGHDQPHGTLHMQDHASERDRTQGTRCINFHVDGKQDQGRENNAMVSGAW